MVSEKYSRFDITEVTYKIVNDQGIKAYILIPKDIIPGNYPVIAKFHGGGYITGSSLYPDWYPTWALEYCLLHSAIVVTGDYRLLPESSAKDMFEDVREDLQSILNTTKPDVEADLSRVIVHGDSAGGTLSMWSGFTQSPGFIKAVIATYPGISPIIERDKPPLGAPIIPPEVLEGHLKSMEKGKIVTAADPPARIDVWLSIAQQSRLMEFWGTDERFDNWKLLEKTSEVPYTLILHGSEDTAVPVAKSIKWVDKIKQKFGEAKIDLYIEPGVEHGFDVELPLNTPWLEERLKKVTALWLEKE